MLAANAGEPGAITIADATTAVPIAPRRVPRVHPLLLTQTPFDGPADSSEAVRRISRS